MGDEELVTTQNYDPWADLANNPPEESAGGDYEDLPPKAWVIARTATSENGRAAPEIRNQEIKSGEHKGKTIFKFSVGLFTIGGDKLIEEAKHKNKMTYYDGFLLPGPKEDQSKPLSGRFTAFLNCLFSPGVGADLDAKDPNRATVRWNHTMQVLREVHQDNPEVSPDAYDKKDEDGNSITTLEERRAKFIAGLAILALDKEPKTLLFKTRDGSYTAKGGDRKGERIAKIEVGAVEDAIPANQENRGVTMFGTGDDVAW